jgi:hypothetical protein
MRSLTVALLAAAAACASPKPDANHPGNGSGSGSGETCHEVQDTGTMFSHTECSPTSDQQDQRDDAQRFMKKPRSQPSSAH